MLTRMASMVRCTSARETGLWRRRNSMRSALCRVTKCGMVATSSVVSRGCAPLLLVSAYLTALASSVGVCGVNGAVAAKPVAEAVAHLMGVRTHGCTAHQPHSRVDVRSAFVADAARVRKIDNLFDGAGHFGSPMGWSRLNPAGAGFALRAFTCAASP